MNKKIKFLISSFIVLVSFVSCQSDTTNIEKDHNDLLDSDSEITLTDSMLKSDKEKSDSILKYYQKKAEEADETSE